MNDESYAIILVYQAGMDGDVVAERTTSDMVEARVKKLKLGSWDYALIKGEIIKTFHNKGYRL